MKKHNILVLVIGLFIMSGCATTPTDDIKVEAEADTKVKFSGYKI